MQAPGAIHVTPKSTFYFFIEDRKRYTVQTVVHHQANGIRPDVDDGDRAFRMRLNGVLTARYYAWQIDPAF